MVFALPAEGDAVISSDLAGDPACEAVRQAARKAELVINAISPLIEACTSSLCPGCESVCCIDRHYRHDESDRIFLAALGRTIPEREAAASETEPCRFLGRQGCSLERADRPYRCTWYFCAALLETIACGVSASENRKFMAMLSAITRARTEMLEEFHAQQTENSSHGEEGNNPK